MWHWQWMNRAQSIPRSLMIMGGLVSVAIAPPLRSQERPSQQPSPAPSSAPKNPNVTAQVPLVDPVWKIASAAATDLAGNEISILPQAEQGFHVLCFLGTECPLAKLYGPRLQSLAARYGDRQVQLLGIFSNIQDDEEEIRRYAREHALSFPLLRDPAQRIADLVVATRTPEVVVIDAEGTIQYRGRIDDQYQIGIARKEPTANDLQQAIEALVAGRDVVVPRTVPVGCLIGREQKPRAQTPATITYSEHVAAILERHCVECHRESQIGPFSLQQYDDVAGWGEMILEVIDQGRMPPWHAAPPHDRFLGARVISSDEVEVIRQWVAQGMAEGGMAEGGMAEGGMAEGGMAGLSERRAWVTGWNLPRVPDLVVPMARKAMEVPATGTVDYQYFVVDPGLTEDRWVEGAQVIPGNPRVVHHAICFIRPPDGREFRGVGWLGAYVPGQQPAVFPPGHARLLPAGSKLVFQMHYTPSGKPETDITKIGIVFADRSAGAEGSSAAEVTHEIVTLAALDQSFEIPPGVKRHAVHGDFGPFPAGARLLSITPHMHYRGAAFLVDLVRPEGGSERLLDVPRYDFNWQHDYRLREPISLDAYDRLQFTAVFDNSAENPANPDPAATVSWGDQSWEEMAVAFFDISRPRNAAGPVGRNRPREEDSSPPQSDAERTSRRTAYVEAFFRDFDRDRDGMILRLETPESFRRFAFGQCDENQDGRIDRDEVDRLAQRRIQ